MDFVGSARGRLGYAAGPWLFYATGGLAFTGLTLYATHIKTAPKRAAA